MVLLYLSISAFQPRDTKEKNTERKWCHRIRKKRPNLKLKPVYHSALSQPISICLLGILHTWEEVESMISLLWIGCAMTILQFSLLLLTYLIWYFLSIHYDVVYLWVMRKTQSSQSGFLFWFEFIQQGFVSSPWLFLPPWLALHRVWNTDHASFSSDLDLPLSERAHSAWCLMGPYFVVFTVV